MFEKVSDKVRGHTGDGNSVSGSDARDHWCDGDVVQTWSDHDDSAKEADLLVCQSQSIESFSEVEHWVQEEPGIAGGVESLSSEDQTIETYHWVWVRVEKTGQTY